MLFGGATNVDEIPRRAFKQDIGCALAAHAYLTLLHPTRGHLHTFCVEYLLGCIIYFTFSPTHYTGERKWTFLIANENIHGGEFAFVSIQCSEFFAVFGRTSNDFHPRF